MSDICILIPDPDYHEDWRPHARLLEQALDMTPAYRHWTDPGDLSAFRLIMPLIAWGYQRAPENWFALLDYMEQEQLPLANPLSVLRWNSDKSYLVELAGRNIATVPTLMSEELNKNALKEAARHFGSDMLIIKPPISGGADGTYKLHFDAPVPDQVAGRRMMTQPFLPAISSEGEFSLFYFDGHFSHAIIKRPAEGDFRVQDYFGGTESAITPPREACHLAEAALAAAPAPCLYARIDLVRDTGGTLRLMELELIEPSLFFKFAADGGRAFGNAVRNYLTR